MAKQITCPSGLAGEIRHLKTKEANHFVNREILQKGLTLDKIIGACWLKTTDVGPYDFSGEGQPDWGQVLTGDRYFVAVEIRKETYGTDFSFPSTCDRCSKSFDVDIDLAEDLEILPLSAESRSKFSAGEPFAVKLPVCGKIIKYRLQRGEDERSLPKKVENDPENRAATLSLAIRVVGIEGVDLNDTVKFVDDLHMRDTTAFMDDVDDSECGIETSYLKACTKCGVEQEVELPLASPEFWMPRKLRRKKILS